MKKGCATIASALLVLSNSTPADAQVPRTWSTDGKTGVHAQGSTWTTHSWINIKGYLKDTKCDGGAASVHFAFLATGTGPIPPWVDRREKVSTVGKPCGTVIPFHFRGYSGKYSEVIAYECVSRRGCSRNISIWKAP